MGGQSANNTGSAKAQRIYKIGECVNKLGLRAVPGTLLSMTAP